MPVLSSALRILVKAKAGLPGASVMFGADRVQLNAQPLFDSIGRRNVLSAAPASQWHILTASSGADETNPWDLCHALLRDGLGIVGAPSPDFAEPDLQQKWIFGDERHQALAMGGSCDAPERQDRRFPEDPNPLWFHNLEHSQLDAALAELADPQDSNRVRVAHFDTGYDPTHLTLPVHLSRSLQRNFVDDDRPNDATDDTDGLLTNPGHGTGTIALLAGTGVNGGPAIGAAPFVEVVPIRVANRVVLFYNSAIARAFDYVHELCGTPSTRVDVITMSMGGLASQAWADAVNALYDEGVFIVTAAGNNYGNLPTGNIVYPARFARVVAACGVMADHTPYADLGIERMAGNYGPDSKMATAISAFTPNTTWAKLGCPGIVDLNGAGTSSSTPQIAAAAAIWIQQNKAALGAYRESWMRVEAVRKAMFATGSLSPTQDKSHFGWGELRAEKALKSAPVASDDLTAQDPDSASFPILRTLTGLGMQAAPDARQSMLELEALQLSQSAELEAILPDPAVPAGSISPKDLQRIADALAAQPTVSQALRRALGVSVRREVRTVAPPVKIASAAGKHQLKHAMSPNTPPPTTRRLRVYAYDPSLATNLDTLDINQATLNVRWEADLRPGPVGEYIEVIDVDPASSCCYAPIDLDHANLLTQDGLGPSEANPQFHQQMAYAVAMTTIDHFERALGRVALWAPHSVGIGGKRRDRFVPRLRIYPHAMRAANAFYSPDKKALLLGYFTASMANSADVLPGGVVFSALSHDIIAHETTHALLDGLHRRFREPTNPDVLAFHEAFADIVALFQHFTMPEALRAQIAKTRGDLRKENLLGQLAVQFGMATGRYGALRDAIGEFKDGQWVPRPPSRDAYSIATEAHDRGAVLVAAVLDAFTRIYQIRTTDLIRLATSGTGVLPEGAIPADLVERLAREASKVAGQLLTICIRALDYCPPVDITFGEYLRALITADRDLVPDDKRTYRVAFVSAFRDRGIYPQEVKNLSVDSLAWEPPPLPLAKLKEILDEMSLVWNLGADRRAAYYTSLANAAKMHAWLSDPSKVSDDELDALGLIRAPDAMTIGMVVGKLGGMEVHSVRPARRIGPDGQSRTDLVVEITQTFRPSAPESASFRGGCTLLIDLEAREVRYFIRKRVQSARRLADQQAFGLATSDMLRNNYFSDRGSVAEPFAMLHRPY